MDGEPAPEQNNEAREEFSEGEQTLVASLVGTRNCCRPVWPPGPSVTVEPVVGEDEVPPR